MRHKRPIVRNIIITIAVVVLVVAANIIRRNSTVRGLEVVVNYGGCDTLVTAQTIEQLVMTDNPTLLSQIVKDVDTRAIQEQVLTSPFVERCQTYVSILGNVVVKPQQRKPIMHVYYGGKEFYVDNLGQYLPLSKEGRAHVMVVNGRFHQPDTVVSPRTNLAELAVDSLGDDYDISHIWQVAHFMDQEEYLSMFDQIYLNQEGDLILTPKLGTHVVNIGNSEELETKFSHLMALYKQALPRVGWNRYSMVNLKFKDQVVCQKRN